MGATASSIQRDTQQRAVREIQDVPHRGVGDPGKPPWLFPPPALTSASEHASPQFLHPILARAAHHQREAPVLRVEAVESQVED